MLTFTVFCDSLSIVKVSALLGPGKVSLSMHIYMSVRISRLQPPPPLFLPGRSAATLAHFDQHTMSFNIMMLSERPQQNNTAPPPLAVAMEIRASN